MLNPSLQEAVQQDIHHRLVLLGYIRLDPSLHLHIVVHAQMAVHGRQVLLVRLRDAKDIVHSVLVKRPAKLCLGKIVQHLVLVILFTYHPEHL